MFIYLNFLRLFDSKHHGHADPDSLHLFHKWRWFIASWIHQLRACTSKSVCSTVHITSKPYYWYIQRQSCTGLHFFLLTHVRSRIHVYKKPCINLWLTFELFHHLMVQIQIRSFLCFSLYPERVLSATVLLFHISSTNSSVFYSLHNFIYLI